MNAQEARALMDTLDQMAEAIQRLTNLALSLERRVKELERGQARH